MKERKGNIINGVDYEHGINYNLLDAFDIIFSITSWVKEIKSKYGIPLKNSLNLYIDIRIKELTLMDVYLANSDCVLKKMSNCEKIEYSLHDLVEAENFFEYKNIEGYSVYIELPEVDKKTQLVSFDEELDRLEKQKTKFEAKLNNESFVTKAPKDILELERKKLNDTKNKINDIKSISLLMNCGKEYYDLLLTFQGDKEKIVDRIQYEREYCSSPWPDSCEKYTPEWFEWYYDIIEREITPEEIKLLYNKMNQ